MRILRIIEFTAAIAIVLIAIFLWGYTVLRDLELSTQSEEISVGVKSFVFGLLILVAPSVCLGIGSYAHAIKQRSWGLFLVLIPGAVNNLLILALSGGIAWAYPGWAVLLFIIQFLLVLIAVAAALLGNRNPTSTFSGRLAGSSLVS